MSMQLPPPLVPEVPAPGEGSKNEGAPAGLRIQRRTLLKLGGVGGALFLTGGWVYRTLLRAGPPAPGMEVLSEEELRVAGAIAETFFPGPPQSPLSAREVGLARYADGYVAELYEDQQQLLRLLLRTMEVSGYVSHGRPFSRLPVSARRGLLSSWKESDLQTRRAAHDTLRLIFSLGFFEDGRVRRALGLGLGCNVSARFPELMGAQ